MVRTRPWRTHTRQCALSLLLTIHVGALYLDEVQKFENTSLVSFEIWTVGLRMGTAHPCFPQNVSTASLVFKRGRNLARHIPHGVHLWTLFDQELHLAFILEQQIDP